MPDVCLQPVTTPCGVCLEHVPINACMQPPDEPHAGGYCMASACRFDHCIVPCFSHRILLHSLLTNLNESSSDSLQQYTFEMSRGQFQSLSFSGLIRGVVNFVQVRATIGFEPVSGV